MINIQAENLDIIQFSSRPSKGDESLKSQFNNWKGKNPFVEVIDMQYSTTASDIFLYSLMVIYRGK